MALWINEQTSTMADFIDKLNTFLTTGGGGNPGWTADRHVPASGEWAVSKAGTNDDVEVAFQWDTGGPSSLGVYQYKSGSGPGNYVPASFPYGQLNDSGNGALSTTEASLIGKRHAAISDSPLQYWCFTGDTYAHVIVQVNATRYTHFGFGVLDKFNDWEGGAYAYGERFQTGIGTDPAIQVGSTHLLDGLIKDGSGGNPTNDQELFAATVHIVGLPQQVASGLWAVVMGDQTDLGNDRQASPKGRMLFVGGYRANEIARSFGVLTTNPQSGFVPGYPISTLYFVRSPSTIYGPMGIMKDVRGVNIDQFEAGDEIVIGSDTWVLFPSYIKGTGSGKSENQGIMYKKN